MAAHGRHALAVALAVASAQAASYGQADALHMDTSKPGNLFISGEAVQVAVRAPGAPTVAWRVADYAGRRVAAGEAELADGAAALALGELPVGYYEATCAAAGQTARMAFGVLPVRAEAKPYDGPVSVDGATAWIEAKGRHGALARMVKAAGIGWMRDRHSWDGTEPERGRDDWSYYDKVTQPFVDQGVRVLGVFHDSPAWSRGDRPGSPNPSDLRDVYSWAKRSAKHWAGRVRAWEIWNEPDIEFWPDSAEAYAGVLKAAYLGLKAADPDLPVLSASLCRGYCAFDENLFECGAAGYFDIFNWHYYGAPASCATALSQYLDLLKRFSCEDRPVWMTEAGVALWASEPGGELSAADERLQAEFVAKSVASSLAAGTDRHFVFLLPHMLDGGVQFGLLREDLSPRPSFVALAAAVDLLGDGRYLGRYPFPDGSGCTGLVFDTGVGRTMVAWAEAPQEVEIEVEAPRVRISNPVGAGELRRAADGRIRLAVGPSPQFVTGLGQDVVRRLTGPVRSPGRMPSLDPSPVVVRGDMPGAELRKAAGCWVIDGGRFEYTVEACNLSERRGAEGRIELQLPEGWVPHPRGRRVSLPPLGRELLQFSIAPGPPVGGTLKLWVRPEFESTKPEPSVSYLRFDAAGVVPRGSLDLGLSSPDAWEPFCSEGADMVIAAGPEGVIRAAASFPTPGDRWCYPIARFDPARDFSAYEGIRFQYRCDRDDPETILRVQLLEPEGSFYLTGDWHATTAWTTVTCLWPDFYWGAFSPSDPDQRLGANAIAGLTIGVNTPRDEARLELRDVRLARFGP